MAKVKADAFCDLVRSSGLVEKDQLNAVLLEVQQSAGGQPITDVDVVASRLVEANLITRWQADRLLEGRHKGFFLGKYKLLNHLGTGGMSSVYLAEHVLMRRRVAIKVLPKNRVEDTSYLARFHREAQAAAALDHRNIVRAYDVDNDGNIHYLVMEYIEGRDVQRIVKDDGPLDYALAADYTRQAADGLAHAHKANLIHRDVKPANLLVDQKGVIKVLDLGLARFTDERKASLTVAYDENVLGTADYLAPEQAIDSHGVDSRADIYGLGCTLYYMLTGHPPFAKGTLPQRLMMHQKQPPPSIYDDRPDAPADLVEICLKMMAKKPGQRYQSAAEVAQALANWQVAHGCSSGSSAGSGPLSSPSSSSPSSPMFVGAVSGEAGAHAVLTGEQPKAAEKAVLVRPKPAEKKRAVPATIAADGSPSFIDTSSDLLRPTVKSPSAADATKPPTGSAKQTLPVASPLSELLADSVLDDELPAGIAHISTRPLQPRGPARRSEQDTFKLLWLVAGAAAALVIILLLLVWLLR